MFAITLGDVGLVDDVAAGLTLGCPPLATLGGLLLLRMAISCLRTLVCCCFLAAVIGNVPRIDLTISVAALTVRSTLEMDGVE